MTINLNTLSKRELDALITQARKRVTTLNKRKPVATVRGKLTALAEAEGYSIAELFGGAIPKPAKTAKTAKPAKSAKKARVAKKASPNKGRKLGKVAPKYRNTANPKEVWSGRGKQPRWMAALTKKGKKPEDFLIKK